MLDHPRQDKPCPSGHASCAPIWRFRACIVATPTDTAKNGGAAVMVPPNARKITDSDCRFYAVQEANLVRERIEGNVD